MTLISCLMLSVGYVVKQELLTGQKVSVVRCEELVISGGCKSHSLLLCLMHTAFINPCKLIFLSFSSFILLHSVVRNHTRYMQFLRKRTLTNPTRGPFHYRAPSRILWRTVSISINTHALFFLREQGRWSAGFASVRWEMMLCCVLMGASLILTVCMYVCMHNHHLQIRGMLPHKTFRGAQALNRLTVSPSLTYTAFAGVKQTSFYSIILSCCLNLYLPPPPPRCYLFINRPSRVSPLLMTQRSV